jgi:alpha-amylase
LSHIFLGLAIHNHQPIGNFPWVFEDCYRRAYLPMIEALQRHPSIKVSLHYSGCLFDWIVEKHPEFIGYLKELSLRGQAEIIGGGYYEPILSAIPDDDKLGQVSRMADFIEQVFHARPRGMWLAERVWEPGLAKVLPEAGVDWTLVDDTGFKMVGKDDDDLFGYFNTEEQGRYLKIFPISKYLRYSIPWHSVEDVMGYLKNCSSDDGDRIAVLGDDGEKFGVWPETYEHCWDNHWVDDFFKAIEDNPGWLSTVRLGDYAVSHQPIGRIYLPCASYDEMLEWSLPAQKSWEYSHLRRRLADENRSDILRYMYCGYWRNFMVKYPEVNRMHKKMLMVHEKVHEAYKVNAEASGMDYLWRAQCNCPCWHGVFGGIYLADIRAVAYSNLIKAEECADQVLSNHKNGYEYKLQDFDGDGREEVLVEGPEFNFYLSPHEGGSIFEWDYREAAYNLLCSVSRAFEGYHRDILAGGNDNEGNAGDGVKSIHDVIRMKQPYTGQPAYDTLPRSSLIDRFLDRNVMLDSFEKNQFADAGDFSGKAYEFSADAGGQSLSMLLKRRGQVTAGQANWSITVEKKVTLSLRSGVVAIDYRFINNSGSVIETIFGSEWNINLLGGGHNESAYYRVTGQELEDGRLDSRGEIDDVRELFMGNTYLGIEMRLSLDRPLKLWRFPVESISNSEGGVEQVYQCSCVVILLPLKIEPGQAAAFHYNWNIEK